MESEDVLILSVDTSAEIVCLGKRRADKGKSAADPSRRQFKKCHNRDGKQFESCLVILDDNSETDYVEMYGGDAVKSAETRSSKDNSDDMECLVSVPKRLNMLESPDEGAAALQSDSAVLSSRLDPKDDDDLDDLILTNETKPVAQPVFSTPSSTLPLKPTGTSTTSLAAEMSVYIPDHHLPDRASSMNYPKSSPSLDKQSNTCTPKSTVPTSPSVELKSSSSSSQLSSLGRTPTCWTNCPNCPPSKKRKYHLIDVAYNSAEWSVVSNPLSLLGFTVTRVRRIQNELLWQRLCFEKQLMISDQRSVNEQLLYHTSRCSIAIICEEGLDARLSMNGNFGRGMYFR